jgi:uncharacterized protein DUF2877
MQLHQLSALSIAPAARDWLGSSGRPRWLHVFDDVCNLVNEHSEVLSIVSQAVGEGPFTLVVEPAALLFPDFLNIESQITLAPDRIILGNIVIKVPGAKIWSPRPDWESLRLHKDNVLNQLMAFTGIRPSTSIPQPLLIALFRSMTAVDIPSALIAARQLAGLGEGLTPAGDDVLLGALLAARIVHPPHSASVLAEAVAGAAAPLTTTFSAAWLRAAAKGDIGIVWHRLLAALISADKTAVHNAMERLAALGHTSGIDALSGFLGLLTFSEDVYDIPRYVH